MARRLDAVMRGFTAQATYLSERIDASAGFLACWPWTLSTGSHGYAQAFDGRTVVCAHRLVWIHLYGDPGGLTVDHRCHVRRCCNPMHLRLLTNVENATDNGQTKKTHCPASHPYAGANLYVSPRGHRKCRQCVRRRVLDRARARRK